MKSVMRNFLVCRLVDRADKEKNLVLIFTAEYLKRKSEERKRD